MRRGLPTEEAAYVLRFEADEKAKALELAQFFKDVRDWSDDVTPTAVKKMRWRVRGEIGAEEWEVFDPATKKP